MIQHPVFIRRIDGKTIVTTILNTDLFKDFPEGDLFVIATTGVSQLKDGLTISMPVKSAMKSEEYVETIAGTHEDTKGQCIEGILREPYWFIKKFKSIVEMMGG